MVKVRTMMWMPLRRRKQWIVGLGHWSTVEAPVLDVGHHADDGFGRHHDVDFLADGIFVRKVSAHQGLIHDHGIGPVARSEKAAAQQRDSKGSKISGTDLSVDHGVASMPTFRKLSAFTRKGVRAAAKIGMERIGEGDCLDSGKRCDSVANFIERDGVARC